MVGADYIKLIWVPDTFFVNEKSAQFHAATQDNQFLRITDKGEILRSIRLTVKVCFDKNKLKNIQLRFVNEGNMSNGSVFVSYGQSTVHLGGGVLWIHNDRPE